MSNKELKREAWEANMELNRRGLVLYTWGNVSQLDRTRGVFAIKPSGVPYDELTADDMVLVDLDNRRVEGRLNPSSDTRTHSHLYRSFDSVGGVAHTHSTYATAWAQAQQDIPCLGTTHADYAYGPVPCTAVMSEEQIARDYEEETGVQITEIVAKRNPLDTPMVVVAGHAPFTWGRDAAESVYHAVVLEEIARMAYLTKAINPAQGPLQQAILDKHYQRKHGKDAYYGQE
jgi:L-ribulose-5-phosphate 4-epimerase